NVEAGLTLARRYDPELLVGVGGGSSMDCATGINFVFSNGGRMPEHRGAGKATKAMLPMIAVPTTAGTGSEAQSYALVTDSKTHDKMACGAPGAALRVAILDPELTVSLPRHVTAATGYDALSHAVESAVTTRRNPLSAVFAREAFRLIDAHFERVLDAPADLDARAALLLGAHLAGLVIVGCLV